MAKHEQWIVWLLKGIGEMLLGLATESEGRFCVIGKVQDTGTVGVWLAIDEIQELAIPDNVVIHRWKVSPKICLIQWGYIAYVQKGDRSKGIGFTAINSR